MEVYQQLEAGLANWANWAGCDPEHMVTCASGTAALHLALEALELPLGSEVIVCDYAMIACARAITLAGMVPRFVDCDRDLLLDMDRADEAIQRSDGEVQAIMAVHTFGRQCDMRGIGQLAQKYGLWIIEDLAEAHGVRPYADTDAACWSFYRNKIVHGEEGGAVAFALPSVAQRARCLRSLGFTAEHDFKHLPRGHNYRMSNAHAQLILRSLEKFSEESAERGVIESVYNAYCPKGWRMPMRDVVWVYDVRIPEMSREKMGRAVKALQEAGIAARYGFFPLSLQREYRQQSRVDTQKLCFQAALAANEVLYLPVQPGVTTNESCKMAFEVIRKAL